MFNLGVGVAAQEAAITRLDMVSRARELTRRESEMLSELLRLQAQRARQRKSRSGRLQARVEAQIAQLLGPFTDRMAA